MKTPSGLTLGEGRADEQHLDSLRTSRPAPLKATSPANFFARRGKRARSRGWARGATVDFVLPFASRQVKARYYDADYKRRSTWFLGGAASAHAASAGARASDDHFAVPLPAGVAAAALNRSNNIHTNNRTGAGNHATLFIERASLALTHTYAMLDVRPK